MLCWLRLEKILVHSWKWELGFSCKRMRMKRQQMETTVNWLETLNLLMMTQAVKLTQKETLTSQMLKKMMTTAQNMMAMKVKA